MNSQPAVEQTPAVPVKGVTMVVPPLYPAQLIASGVQLSNVPDEPLVSIAPSFSVDGGYELYVAVYLPAGSINVTGSSDFTTTEEVETEAGNINVRDVFISYTAQDVATSAAYDLWQFHFLYRVGLNDNAQAVRVRTSENDPITRRGTVTTVIKT
jgi:hypothetical protein